MSPTPREAARRVLFVGRFQPPHLGHLAVIEHLARTHEGVLVGIGSAFDSHTLKNPFTAGERYAMLEGLVEEAGIENVRIVPIPDLNRNALWVHHVRSILPPFDAFVSNNALPRRLFREAGYRVEGFPLTERTRYEGSRIRDALLRDEGWDDLVPASVARMLRGVGASERLRDLAESDKGRD